MPPELPVANNSTPLTAASASEITSWPSVASIAISVFSSFGNWPKTRTELPTVTCGPVISIEPKDVEIGDVSVRSLPD